MTTTTSTIGLTQQQAIHEPMIGAEEELQAIIDWQDKGDKRALEKLIRSHARLSYSTAARYTKNSDHLSDLAAAGMQGIMRAADRFNRDAGTRFATYAKWWIKTFVSNEVGKVSVVVDIPSRIYLDTKMGRIEGERGDRAQMAVFGGIDLHAPLGEDGATSAMDRLECPRPTPESSVNIMRKETTFEEAVAKSMKKLTTRERNIIKRRRLKDPPDTLDIIADDIEVTRERVRQIEVKAMGKLKSTLVKEGFPISLLQGN